MRFFALRAENFCFFGAGASGGVPCFFARLRSPSKSPKEFGAVKQGCNLSFCQFGKINCKLERAPAPQNNLPEFISDRVSHFGERGWL